MKRILLPILSITAVLALMAPSTASAEATPTPKPKAKAGGPPGGGGGAPQFKQQVVKPQPQVTHTPFAKPVVHNTSQPTPAPGTSKPLYHKPVTGTNPTPAPTKGTFTKKPPVVNNTNVSKNTTVNNNTTVVKAASHTTHIKQVKSWAGPKASGGGGGPQFSAANNYGGHWVAAGGVPNGWSHGGVHSWHNHQYRWFNGGWLIVDGGFWPAGYYQLNGSSKMWNAQAELANMGYYDGPVDGIPGPDTRQAIANYQNDYNLPVTGHLNYPTQESLGLVDSD